MTKNFDLFIKRLTTTNITLDYFVDFSKVQINANKIAIKLNQLNYLLDKKDLLQAIEELFQENPQVFDVLNFLIAVRDSKTLVVADDLNTQTLSDFLQTPSTNL